MIKQSSDKINKLTFLEQEKAIKRYSKEDKNGVAVIELTK
ncbi:hypothetical protein CCYN49044_200083 [Capnocytophaga cynodegmi]|uniref:Uncharacterized protein n=1 Tax=Capnocytophaga cynodegmi TaxID=28189 RepID=A0A0B7HGW5_9FLAO|nr:hypothetical protein CCYN74_100083 [Capnocytophaga cynodegmi]CEN37904.1 hypothetical protein CCYN49044_200083 [Capnocytophaga cynodegmi]